MKKIDFKLDIGTCLIFKIMLRAAIIIVKKMFLVVAWDLLKIWKNSKNGIRWKKIKNKSEEKSWRQEENTWKEEGEKKWHKNKKIKKKKWTIKTIKKLIYNRGNKNKNNIKKNITKK